MRQEIPYIHVVRAVACTMVLCLHTLPNFAISGLDNYFLQFMRLFTRPCVPLFLMITGVLLLPNRNEKIFCFYKKRITKILFPLLFWGIVYSIIPYFLGIEKEHEMLSSLTLIMLTYPQEIGGILWYLYILIGLYLILPFINPAIFENIQMLCVYIFLWFFTSFTNLIKCYYPQVLGITPFCSYDMLIYFSGYLGYLFLGYLIHHHFHNHLIKNKINFKILLLCVYFASIFIIVIIRNDVNGNVMMNFLSFPAIIMSSVVFIFIKTLKINTENIYYEIIKKLSHLSFGIYLSHMLIYRIFTVNLYNISTSIFMQIIVMLCTFLAAYFFTLFITKLPHSKYIVGI